MAAVVVAAAAPAAVVAGALARAAAEERLAELGRFFVERQGLPLDPFEAVARDLGQPGRRAASPAVWSVLQAPRERSWHPYC